MASFSHLRIAAGDFSLELEQCFLCLLSQQSVIQKIAATRMESINGHSAWLRAICEPLKLDCVLFWCYNRLQLKTP